jgi:hypothetical protein
MRVRCCDQVSSEPRLRKPVSFVDLQAAINRYLVEHNANPKPFVWTASASAILNKLKRLLGP